MFSCCFCASSGATNSSQPSTSTSTHRVTAISPRSRTGRSLYQAAPAASCSESLLTGASVMFCGHAELHPAGILFVVRAAQLEMPEGFAGKYRFVTQLLQVTRHQLRRTCATFRLQRRRRGLQGDAGKPQVLRNLARQGGHAAREARLVIASQPLYPLEQTLPA